jgi:hypothetical protein
VLAAKPDISICEAIREEGYYTPRKPAASVEELFVGERNEAAQLASSN